MAQVEKANLKGSVLAGRTINTGRFNSYKIELYAEFLLAESDHEKIIEFLTEKIAKTLKAAGVVQRYD